MSWLKELNKTAEGFDLMSRACKWVAEGPKWTWELEGNSSDDPKEIAALCVDDYVCNEAYQLKGNFIDGDGDKITDLDGLMIGAAIKITNSLMNSIDQHVFVLTPKLLANSGKYDVAELVKESMRGQ